MFLKASATTECHYCYKTIPIATIARSDVRPMISTFVKFCEILKFGNNLKLEIIDYILKKIITLNEVKSRKVARNKKKLLLCSYAFFDLYFNIPVLNLSNHGYISKFDLSVTGIFCIGLQCGIFSCGV